MLINFPSAPHAVGHIHGGLIGDHIGEAIKLSRQLRYQGVDILSLFLRPGTTFD